MDLDKLEEQRIKDKLRATPKSIRMKHPLINNTWRRATAYEKPVNQPLPTVDESSSITTDSQFSIYPSSLRCNVQASSLGLQRQTSLLNYFNNKPIETPPKKHSNIEIKIEGNIVSIINTNNESIIFDKKQLVGYQVSMNEEKIIIILQSNNLSIPFVYYEDWLNVISELQLIISNKESPLTCTKPTLMSRLVKCFSKTPK